jgi:aromatic ring-opening dioxygenase catalytic subunit (LigB family)
MTVKMPILFLGHSNPMNALEENKSISLFNDKLWAGSLSLALLKTT